jgi:hypothetical protein
MVSNLIKFKMTKAYNYLAKFLIAYLWVMGVLWIVSIDDVVALVILKVYLALSIVILTKAWK